MGWFLDPGDERRAASDSSRRMLWDAAAALGAHHVKVGNIPGTPCPLERVTERFAELCDDAASNHDALIVYEFMPFDVNVRTLEAAQAVVGGAARANGALAFDTWHLSKLGIAPHDVRRVPRAQVGWVELSDGQFADMDDPIDEVVNHRRLPGEGEFDIRGYVDAFRELGYDGPWGVEVLSAELRALPIAEIFDRAHATTAAQFRDPPARGREGDRATDERSDG
jgi:sugar phosphate isomerase/epimerase